MRSHEHRQEINFVGYRIRWQAHGNGDGLNLMYKLVWDYQDFLELMQWDSSFGCTALIVLSTINYYLSSFQNISYLYSIIYNLNIKKKTFIPIQYRVFYK